VTFHVWSFVFRCDFRLPNPVMMTNSFSIAMWSPSLVLQLVSEPVWSLVGFNTLCDPNAIWRKML
jgi:hypothetical protein